MNERIPLYYWNGRKNFGDELSQAVVEWATDRSAEYVPQESHGKLLAIGSILQMAQEGDTIWGSGVHPAFYHRYFVKEGRLFRRGKMAVPRVTALSVRGPITRDVIIASGWECPELYGDPGLLTPLFYRPNVTVAHVLGLIPHFCDQAKYRSSKYHVIDVQRSWQEVVDDICGCERIVSTSLHGIILAEAYGIPAIWLRETSSEGYLKYNDYFAGTGRIARPAYSIDEALTMKVPSAPEYDQAQLLSALRTHFGAPRAVLLSEIAQRTKTLNAGHTNE